MPVTRHLRTVLVCGGRNYSDRGRVFAVLDRVQPDRVIHGSAPGADSLAEAWAKDRQVDYAGYPAKWKQRGNPAGMERNHWMLDCHPEIVGIVAFPGDKGTPAMCREAERRGIPVHRVDWADESKNP